MKKKTVVTVVFILIFAASVLLSGCESKIATKLFINVPIDLSYKKTDDYHDGHYCFTKYYYFDGKINRYQKKESEFFVVSSDNIEYIKKMIKCFEYSYNKEYEESPDSFTGEIKDNYDFDISNDIKEGDLFFYSFDTTDTLNSSVVIPENIDYRTINILYVSFENEIAYYFYHGTNFTYMFDSEDEEFRKWNYGFSCGGMSQDEISEMIEKRYNRNEKVEEKLLSLNYYYELQDDSFSVQEICLEYESIDAIYAEDEYSMTISAVGYIKSEFRDWSEDDFFFHYAMFFGNSPITYFEDDGTRYMQIETRYFTYYFFINDGDYIIEFWNNYFSKPEPSQLRVEKCLISW